MLSSFKPLLYTWETTLNSCFKVIRSVAVCGVGMHLWFTHYFDVNMIVLLFIYWTANVDLDGIWHITVDFFPCIQRNVDEICK